MQNAADGAQRFEEYDDSFGAVVSSLISLVEHVQASIHLIEGAIVRETSLGDGAAGNVIVLDDVTPRYPRASTALNACRASLRTALHVLGDKGSPQRGIR